MRSRLQIVKVHKARLQLDNMEIRSLHTFCKMLKCRQVVPKKVRNFRAMKGRGAVWANMGHFWPFLATLDNFKPLLPKNMVSPKLLKFCLHVFVNMYTLYCRPFVHIIDRLKQKEDFGLADCDANLPPSLLHGSGQRLRGRP